MIFENILLIIQKCFFFQLSKIHKLACAMMISQSSKKNSQICPTATQLSASSARLISAPEEPISAAIVTWDPPTQKKKHDSKRSSWKWPIARYIFATSTNNTIKNQQKKQILSPKTWTGDDDDAGLLLLSRLIPCVLPVKPHFRVSLLARLFFLLGSQTAPTPRAPSTHQPSPFSLCGCSYTL